MQIGLSEMLLILEGWSDYKAFTQYAALGVTVGPVSEFHSNYQAIEVVVSKLDVTKIKTGLDL